MNIGTEFKPKMINTGSSCSNEERTRAKWFLYEYLDVFSWGYEDLKTLKNGEFKHKIPLKPKEIPFRQKQRNYNPYLDSIFYIHILLYIFLTQQSRLS